jgi:hypothetical protein
MAEPREAFVGIDVAKRRNAVALADAGRDGEVRFFGEVDASPESMRRLAAKLAAKYDRLDFCYEAGPTGYGLPRLLTGLGHACIVVAPSLIPKKPSDRVKTNRRDAITLARLLRAGELTAVWVPDTAHEAIRNLVRARTAAVKDVGLKSARSAPSSCATAGSSRARRTGVLATMAGCRRRASSILPTRSSCRRASRLCASPRNGWCASSKRSRSSCRPGAWPRWSRRCRRCAASTWSRP